MNLNIRMGQSFSEYRKYGQKQIKIDNNEKCNEERLFYREENKGMFNEIFYPFHGRQIVKLDNSQIYFSN